MIRWTDDMPKEVRAKMLKSATPRPMNFSQAARLITRRRRSWCGTTPNELRDYTVALKTP